MIYHIIGYGNMPLIGMVVTKYKESQENYVFHLMKLFGVYYQTNVSLADVITRNTSNRHIFNFFLTICVTHCNFPQITSGLELIFL